MIAGIYILENPPIFQLFHEAYLLQEYYLFPSSILFHISNLISYFIAVVM